MSAAKKTKHKWVRREFTALGDAGPRQFQPHIQVVELASKFQRGSYQVFGNHWRTQVVEYSDCERCGTRVFSNAVTMARAVCNAKGIDCDTVIVEAVHSL